MHEDPNETQMIKDAEAFNRLFAKSGTHINPCSEMTIADIFLSFLDGTAGFIDLFNYCRRLAGYESLLDSLFA
jgi:hypothetical protein